MWHWQHDASSKTLFYKLYHVDVVVVLVVKKREGEKTKLALKGVKMEQ